MGERPCRRHRRRRRGRDLHAGRCRGGFYRSSPVLHSKLLLLRCAARAEHAPVEKVGHLSGLSKIRELGFVLACYYVVYEHGNVARQGRKSIHGRTGQYLPVKRHCTRIFPTGRVLYARLIHFALEPRPIAAPLWHPTNDYQRTTVFHLFPNVWLPPPPSFTFHLLVFSFFFITFYLLQPRSFTPWLCMNELTLSFYYECWIRDRVGFSVIRKFVLLVMNFCRVFEVVAEFIYCYVWKWIKIEYLFRKCND